MATPGVLDAVPRSELFSALQRHLQGDWGDLSSTDRRNNGQALRKGGQLFSVYHSSTGVKFWIITEADRSCTTFLLPSEY